MKNKTRGMVIVPILIGLAVAAVVWVAGYRGGGARLADANGPHSNLAAAPISASTASTISEGSNVPASATQSAEMAKD